MRSVPVPCPEARGPMNQQPQQNPACAEIARNETTHTEIQRARVNPAVTSPTANKLEQSPKSDLDARRLILAQIQQSFN